MICENGKKTEIPSSLSSITSYVKILEYFIYAEGIELSAIEFSVLWQGK